MNEDDEAFIDGCDVDMQVTADDLMRGYEEMREMKKAPFLSRGMRGRIVKSIRNKMSRRGLLSDNDPLVSLEDMKANIEAMLKKEVDADVHKDDGDHDESDSLSQSVVGAIGVADQ